MLEQGVGVERVWLIQGARVFIGLGGGRGKEGSGVIIVVGGLQRGIRLG